MKTAQKNTPLALNEDEKLTKSISIHKETTLYQGFFRYCHLELSHSLYEGGYSETMQREVFERGNAVVVLLYDPNAQSIVLVEQFRAGAAKKANNKNTPETAWLLEPVAGMIDVGETPEEAAIRESLEETGANIHSLEFISKYYPSPGACDEEILLFAAQVDENQVLKHAGNANEHEDIKVVVMPYAEAKSKLLNAEFNVASTFLAVQWLFFQKLPQTRQD